VVFTPEDSDGGMKSIVEEAIATALADLRRPGGVAACMSEDEFRDVLDEIDADTLFQYGDMYSLPKEPQGVSFYVKEAVSQFQGALNLMTAPSSTTVADIGHYVCSRPAWRDLGSRDDIICEFDDAVFSSAEEEAAHIRNAPRKKHCTYKGNRVLPGITLGELFSDVDGGFCDETPTLVFAWNDPKQDATSSGWEMCFSGNSLVRLADGREKRIDKLNDGEVVWTLRGPCAIARVVSTAIHDVRQLCPLPAAPGPNGAGNVPMDDCSKNTAWITRKHPVLPRGGATATRQQPHTRAHGDQANLDVLTVGGETLDWVHPHTIYTPQAVYVDTLFNLEMNAPRGALQNTCEVQGMVCATLGLGPANLREEFPEADAKYGRGFSPSLQSSSSSSSRPTADARTPP
jgi:hypothetical protein